MGKLKQIICIEMNVEFFSCVHSISTIFLYGFLRWVTGRESVDFVNIFQILVLGYLISWVQRLMFSREKAYGPGEYRIRQVLWCLLPMLLVGGFGIFFHWFSKDAAWVGPVFYVIMTLYFIMIWFFLEIFYREDTEKMNRLLQGRQERKKKKEEA